MDRMTRTLAFALTALAAAFPLVAPAGAQLLAPPVHAPAQTVVLTVELMGPARDSALAGANRTLNSVTRMQGRFVQSSPDGSRAGGTFYLQRPGKLRFEYDAPATMLIVADGSVVAMRDRALRTTERTPLRSTPLNLVLRAQVDLARDARITHVARAGDAFLITARDRSGQTDGEITLQFQGAAMVLSSWEVTDATGARTRIALLNVSQPAAFDPRLFRLQDIVENRPGPH